MRYRTHLPLALQEVSFSIPAGARTGVIGRTGSGKSTLVACLFRLHEVESGRVLIDGVDLSGLGLRRMRKHVTVVPQDPVLMQGTVRTNLDPFGKVNEDALRRSLRCSFMAGGDDEAKATLDRELAVGGSNLSCGERQLMCLARAVIQEPTVLVLDEPTSSTDADTDKKLQAMLRTEFKCTSLCIAHRIQTVADSDLILVMRDGRLLEAGSPGELVKNDGGEFRALCELGGVQIPQKEELINV
jgi:ABC-type multidrug transport system fused ATPase/permease subunit